jgi:DNA adenine methylase
MYQLEKNQSDLFGNISTDSANNKIEQENNKKSLFLQKLRTKNGYKRYLGSPLRYAGGKSLAVGAIIENIPSTVKKVVSPFIGGGSVEIAIAKELNIEVFGYDIFDLLVNYWQRQVKEPEKLYQELSKIENTKEEYEKIKNILKNNWDKNKGITNNDNLTPLQLATYYYFNHNLSYGPGFLGWMSSIYTEKKRYLSMLQKVKLFDVPNLQVQKETFETSIPKHNGDFLYLDPPYFLAGDSKMFKGIYPMRNFPVHHNNFRHDILVDLLQKHKGGFILSYNDCSWVRESYKNFQIIEIAWQYTMGQGETRIGKNRLERDYDNGNVKSSHELLIIGK